MLSLSLPFQFRSFFVLTLGSHKRIGPSSLWVVFLRELILRDWGLEMGLKMVIYLPYFLVFPKAIIALFSYVQRYLSQTVLPTHPNLGVGVSFSPPPAVPPCNNAGASWSPPDGRCRRQRNVFRSDEIPAKDFSHSTQSTRFVQFKFWWDTGGSGATNSSCSWTQLDTSTIAVGRLEE